MTPLRYFSLFSPLVTGFLELCVSPEAKYEEGEGGGGVRGGGNLVCSLFSFATACAFSYYIHVTVPF